jgi:hypothetical protein
VASIKPSQESVAEGISIIVLQSPFIVGNVVMLGIGGLVSPIITSVVSVLSQSPVPVIAQLY